MICFVFKQKTAYEMRISDWSSDVCSSDLYSRVDVGNRIARLERIAPFFASDAHDAAERLGDQIESAFVGIRACAPVAGDGAINQAWVDFGNIFPPQAQTVHGALAIVFKKYITALRHALDRKSTRLNSSH